MSSIEVVRFHGDEIQAVREGEDVWVVVKRVCEALGVDQDSQRKKLKEKPWACTAMNTVHDLSGREQELFCLSLDSLPMWLAGIEPARVKPEAREKLVAYQRECARVLRDHFFGKRHEPANDNTVITKLAQLFEAMVARQEALEQRVLGELAELRSIRQQQLGDGGGSVSGHEEGEIRRTVATIVTLEMKQPGRHLSRRSAFQKLYRDIAMHACFGRDYRGVGELPRAKLPYVKTYLASRLSDAVAAAPSTQPSLFDVLDIH